MKKIFEERNYIRSLHKIYVNTPQDEKVTVAQRKYDGQGSWKSLRVFLIAIFFPQGYPESVSSDYLNYQLWDSAQALSSTITSTIATRSIFKGIGVGDQNSTVISATITWLLRDGVGKLGHIAFIYFQGSKLDIDCKKWRLFADILNDISIAVDLLSPLIMDYIILAQCVSGLFKSIVGAVGGATRAALTQHQARKNNLADVSAKDASQETLVNLIALLASLIIMPIINDSEKLIWLIFIALTIFHVYCNYRAVKSVSLEIFNATRFAYFVDHYLSDGSICNVKTVNEQENVVFFRSHPFVNCVRLGVSLEKHVADKRLMKNIVNEKSNYILTLNLKKKIVYISFFENKDDPLNQLEALFHAYCILFYIESPSNKKDISKDIGGDMNISTKDATEIVLVTKKFSSCCFSNLIKKASIHGWDTSKVLLLEEGWRVWPFE